MECSPPPRTVAAARKVGFAASRDGHFIFRFVAPKIHGIIYFLKEMFIDAHICILFANISFALQRKSRFTLEG